MSMLKRLWSDESAMVLSSEMVLVGTIGVIGATVGLKAVAESVNQELTDVAMAVRSLDQSYSLAGTTGCGAETAGSCFRQQDVKKSLDELCAVVSKEKQAAEKREAEILKEHEAKKEGDSKQPETKKPENKKPDSKKRDDKKPNPKKSEQSKNNKAQTEVIL